MDATRPFSGEEAATASIAVCFASEQRLGICKSRYRKAVLAWPNSRELACSCRRKGGDRSHRLAHVSAQPFLFATCVGRRSQGPAGVAASCGYSYDDEYLHARGSRRLERSKQQSGSFGAASAGS